MRLCVKAVVILAVIQGGAVALAGHVPQTLDDNVSLYTAPLPGSEDGYLEFMTPPGEGIVISALSGTIDMPQDGPAISTPGGIILREEHTGWSMGNGIAKVMGDDCMFAGDKADFDWVQETGFEYAFAWSVCEKKLPYLQ